MRAIGILLAVVLPLAALAAPATPAGSVGAELGLHEREKRLLPGESESARAERLLERGLAADRPDSEGCALYVKRELSPDQFARLRASGVEFHSEVWVPPVPGRHPYGLYRARIPYASLAAVARSPHVVALRSLEYAAGPLNNVARVAAHIEEVQSGTIATARTGANVNLAVADSGLDTTHPDLPTPVEAFDVTDGTDPATWGDDVSNTLIDHGTHVTGTAVGNGSLSAGNAGNGGGSYAGAAPGARLHFYKIGNDVNANATFDDMIEAIQRAQAVGCQVFSMSYGGLSSTHLDGSSPVCQAIDAAAEAGMTVVVSAGNDAQRARHASARVPPGADGAVIDYRIVHGGAATYAATQQFRLVWRDAAPGAADVIVTALDLQAGESLVELSRETSLRGTEAKIIELTPAVAPGTTRTYRLRLSNPIAGGAAPRAHLYRVSGKGTFVDADPAYTVGHPALCDAAIAVGSWDHRASWQSHDGQEWDASNLTQDALSSFSSRGPRVDGRRKPEVVAPGAMTISTRDGTFATQNSLIVDDDGFDLSGSGPAHYYALQGTSQAAPLVAGSAALLLETHPGLVPIGVRNALRLTSSRAATPDDDEGYGRIDVAAAVGGVSDPALDADGDWFAATGAGVDDCDDANPRVWAVPGPVRDVEFADRVTLRWSDPAVPSGEPTPYDVLRSSDPADFAAGASCIESADAFDRVAFAPDLPAPASALFFLVRARNACPGGTGPLGPGPDGGERPGPVCD